MHWDGKMLPHLTKDEKVERLPILISQPSGVQLLSAPECGTSGQQIADIVHETLIEWNAAQNVVGMSFDTTGTNTGSTNGACKLLEDKLGRKLMKLACRHHVYEVMLKTAFETKFGATSAPTITSFDRFKKEWNNIDQRNFEPGVGDPFIENAVRDVSNDVIQFCKSELKKNFARADYKELLELTLIFLGEDRGIIHFCKPGSTSTVRWMSKALYVLKMQMFMHEFDEYSASDKRAIRDLSIFVVRLYTKAFTQCTDPLGAPKNDLNFLKAIQNYATIDQDISSKVLKKFGTHLWYLHPENVGLAFFDKNVSVDEKRRMTQRLESLSIDEINDMPSPFRFVIHPPQMSHLQEWQLDYFINENTFIFFERFDIKIDFMLKDPSEWDTDRDYCEARTKLQTLKVVNDHAERAVKLVSDYNRILTKNETQLQNVLQVVAESRQTKGPLTKTGLSRNYSKK